MAEDTQEQINTEEFAENAIIVNIVHPEWGTWRVIKSPTPAEDWYHIRGDSGNVVMHKCETHFWRLVEDVVKRSCASERKQAILTEAITQLKEIETPLNFGRVVAVDGHTYHVTIIDQEAI